MRAGKMIIANYSNKAIDLLLPELEKGMLDPSWRIRVSLVSHYRVFCLPFRSNHPLRSLVSYYTRSLVLVARSKWRKKMPRRTRTMPESHLSKPSGQTNGIGCWRLSTSFDKTRWRTSGKPQSTSGRRLFKVSLFMPRRESADENTDTPRTTREILPVLMQLIMSLLGSDEPEQQETASRTLGELCRKNGERIFGEIMPILQKAITSNDDRSKEGACLAFADVM